MASIRLSNLLGVQVEQLHGCVHRSAEDKVSGVVKLCAPDRSCVFKEGSCTAAVDEVPDFD